MNLIQRLFRNQTSIQATLSDYQQSRKAEAREKARPLPATHTCEVGVIVHEACSFNGLFISKDTGEVLGETCGGVRVVGLHLWPEAIKVKSALLRLLDKILSSEMSRVVFEPEVGCAGIWTCSLQIGQRDYVLCFSLGWRWLNLGYSHLRCELTTDEYDAIEQRLNKWKTPAPPDIDDIIAAAG